MAELFSLLSTPIRLRIIGALCTQVAIELDPHAEIEPTDLLLPCGVR
ncbi:hypothetical protein [Sphaerotilus sp.]